MGTFLSFHIKTKDRDNLIHLLKVLSGTKEKVTDTFPEYMYDSISLNENSDPSILAITLNKDGWISVHHNTFQKLHHWGEFISKTLNTTFIQIIGQTTSDAYYFLLYEGGNIRREIEVMNSEVSLDKGQKFSFEKEPLLNDNFEDPENSFDIDSLEEYCKEFDLDLNFECDQYTILTITTNEPANEDEDKDANKKAWWKLW